VTYHLLLNKKKALRFYENLPEKSKKILTEKLQELSIDPYPGGNKERLCIRGRKDYLRMHISRSLTLFYTIHEKDKSVHILEILTIEQAHKKYGTLHRDE